jgi:hypothetical protein
MEDRLWIEDIVVAFHQFRFDMVSFMDLHKVVVRRNAFSIFPSAQNEGESKGRVESEGLKHQLSQVESNLNLQEMLKLIPISKKTPRKK